MTKTAVFFHPDAVESESKDLVGRRSSGQSFLRGYLQHVPGETVNAVVAHKPHADAFEKAAREMGETRRIEIATLQAGQNFSKFGTIFFPAPGFQNAAWMRQRFGATSCSLVGITHTVSTRRVLEGLHSLLLEPVFDWDAIICTSRAVQDVVQQQLAVSANFARQKFGAAQVPQPQLPRVPLGINTDDFATSEAGRRAMRSRFGAGEDATVVMTMGRLTSVEKAHPIPMFMALEKAAQASKTPVHLWMVGWAARESEAQLHRDAAKAYCPSVAVQFIDGRAADVRRDIWSGADIFTLPVDNIQETFGLVPVEAMAAGLPVVMPDWNGFKDTIVDGETGILVPTRMNAAGQVLGASLARRYADGSDAYLQHLSVIQQQTAVDIDAYTHALHTLINDPVLRRKMGQAGQKHAKQSFDWGAVIPQYLDLAKALEERRSSAKIDTNLTNPFEIDPFHLYRAYPSAALAPADTINHLSALDAKGLERLDSLNGRVLYKRKILPDAKLLEASDIIATHNGIDVATLAMEMDLSLDLTGALVLFLAKYNFVAITSQLPK